MKRKYMAPDIKTLDFIMEDVIAASSVTSNNGLDYGGIDEDGNMEAETRMLLDDFTFD